MTWMDKEIEKMKKIKMEKDEEEHLKNLSLQPNRSGSLIRFILNKVMDSENFHKRGR